jgi:Ca2+-binding RTX toxin-like protein
MKNMATPLSNSVELPALDAGNGTLSDEMILGLVQGGSWQFAGAPVLTYSYDLNFDGPVQAWPADWISALERAFAAWEAVANIDFLQSGTVNAQTQNASVADLSLVVAPGTGQGVVAASAIFPDPAFADLLLADWGYTRAGGVFPYPGPEGDITFDNLNLAFASLAPGTEGFAIILHEIGHALGLKHPHDDGGNARPTFEALGIAAYESLSYTVMSSPYPLGGSYAMTPMLADILALQHIYGANTAYHNGDDTYGLYGVLGTIWDAGGIDTIDSSGWPGAEGVLIDLRPGAYSGSRGAAGTTAIAYGTTIEHAIGTASYDAIVGNDAPNMLSGMAGNDTLDGAGGLDTLTGGLGDDVYVIHDQYEVLVELAGQGWDEVSSGSSHMLADGPSIEALRLTGTAAANASGNLVTNVVIGNAAANVLDGRGAVDILAGEAGNDTYIVSQATPSSYAQLWGGAIEASGLPGYYGDGTFGLFSANAAVSPWLSSVYLDFSGTDVDGPTSLILRTPGIMQPGLYTIDTSQLYHAEVVASGSGYGGSSTAGWIEIADFAFDASTEAGVLRFAARFDVRLYTGQSLAGQLSFNSFALPSADLVVEKPAGGLDTVSSSVSFVLPTDVENLVLRGVQPIGGTGNALANVITGNAAANRLDGGAGADTLKGGAGDDVYLVDSILDVLVEGANAGIDEVLSTVSFTLPASIEKLTLAGTGNVGVTGNPLANVLTGNSSGNTLLGRAGNDTLDGGVGADSMWGGTGDDVYFVDSLADRVSEAAGAGDDSIVSSVSFTIRPNFETLRLAGSANVNATGGSYGDVLVGNDAVNVLTGMAGHDTLSGGQGDDRLKGGTGNDLLTGGEGRDSFFFAETAGASNADVIADFSSGADKIRLDDAIFVAAGAVGNLLAADPRFHAAAGAVSGQDAADRFVYDTVSGRLYYDGDGNGAAASLLIGTLQGAPALRAIDLVIA